MLKAYAYNALMSTLIKLLVSAIPVNIDLDLDRFLHDFVELMPLMHWLHQSIPQAETSKYLHALQRVFHAYSLFTEQVDRNLVDGLDHILRTLSNNPQFDGYTQGKLSEAFSYFQQYFESKGVRNHLGNKYNWNYHELFTIPQLQFDEVLALEINDFDRHAIRLLKEWKFNNFIILTRPFSPA